MLIPITNTFINAGRYFMNLIVNNNNAIPNVIEMIFLTVLFINLNLIMP